MITSASITLVFVVWGFALSYELVPRTYVPGIEEITEGFKTFLMPDRKRNTFSYFAFPDGGGFWAAYGLTALRVSLAVSLGGLAGIAFGLVNGAVPALRESSMLWLVFWHDVVPRLLLILYVTSIGIAGTSAAVLIAGLSVFCIVGLTTMVSVQDPELREQIECASLETGNRMRIMLAIALPQKAHVIAAAWSLGVTSALSLTYFVEYMQSARGLGYYLQIAFSSEAKIPEALAVSAFGFALVVAWVGVILLLARHASAVCLYLARVR
jgi:ABC-type nitrate/sulfonate/bicarbonate transport system permease component